MTTINGIPLSNSAIKVLQHWDLGGDDPIPEYYVSYLGEVQDYLTEKLGESDSEDPVLLVHLANLIAMKRDFQKIMKQDKEEGGNR